MTWKQKDAWLERGRGSARVAEDKRVNMIKFIIYMYENAIM